MEFENLDSIETIIQMRIEPDFSIIKSEILTLLADNREIVLATALADRVSARTVSFVNDEFTIYFLSWVHNKKITQIKGNKNVAFTLQNLQIEAEAEVLGNAFDGNYSAIGELFKSKFSPKWFDSFSKIKEMVLVKAVPIRIIRFITQHRRFHLQNIDPVNKKSYQMRIEDKDNTHFPY